MNTKHLILACPLLLVLACNQKKEFGGAVDAAKIPEKKAVVMEQNKDFIPSGPVVREEIPSQQAETPTIPKCEVGESEVTKVTLLSTGVDLSKENQIIKYELSMLSCKDGTVVPINDQAIAFDLDLQYYDGGNSKLGYKIVESSSKTSLASGDLLTVENSDLFGHTGPAYRHWTTTNVSFASKVEKVTLEINLKKAKLKTIKASDKEADSYLRMGKASAVTQSIQIIAQ